MMSLQTNGKERKDDRVLVLKTKDGAKPKSSTGLIDPRLFNGENNLHVIKNKQNLWSFKYDQGGLPPQLREQFTTFDLAVKHATKYFNTRNVTIAEIID